MAKKPEFKIVYKYPGEPWLEYDRTMVPNWAETQAGRCKLEHPGAKVEVQVKK